MEQLTLFAAAPHAKGSALQDSEEAWMTTVLTWPSGFLELLTAHGPDGWSGKTSPESYPVGPVRRKIRLSMNKDGKVKKQVISQPSPTRWRNSAMASSCERLTLNTSEWTATLVPCHSDDGVCSLSDILETGDLPQRYYLSAKACAGILRRAEKRGKALPAMLQSALEARAGE